MGKRVPVRTKAKLRKAANEHMTILQAILQGHGLLSVQDRRIRYVA
jgi:hypothetical protein